MTFKIKPFTPKSDAKITQGIESIYDSTPVLETDASITKPTSSGKSWWVAVIVILLVLSVGAAWLGSRVFSSNKSFKQDRVSIKLDGPRTVASSEEVTYTVSYRNDDPNPMTHVVVNLEYPQGFNVINTDPVAGNALGNRWERDLLKTGESGTIHIKGQLHGDEGKEQTFKATITYVPANFNSPFSQEDTLGVTVQSSLLHMELHGPTQANPGDEVQYDITYDNFAEIYQKDDVQLRVTYPNGFAFKESQPKADFGQDTWTAQTLLNGIDPTSGKGTIRITGIFNTESPMGTVELGAMFGYGHNDVFTPEKKDVISTELSKSDLGLKVHIRELGSQTTVNVGQPLTVIVDYQNNGKETLSNITLSTKLEGSVIDWSTLKNSTAAEFNDNTLTWTKGKTASLAALAPGAKGTVSFGVMVHNAQGIADLIKAGIVDSNRELSFNTSALGVYTLGSGDVSSDTVQAKTGIQTIRINSDLGLTTQARYFDDQNNPIGSGPLPPRVGKTTTYTIQWSVQNTLHELNQIRVTTVLPPNVTWSSHERADVGTIEYDQATRSVTWLIDRMTTDQSVRTSDFTISINPAASYSQSLITLTGETGITAQDSINNTSVSLKRPALTSNLDFDPVAKGKGLVLP